MRVLYFGDAPLFEGIKGVKADYCTVFARELGTVTHSVDKNKKKSLGRVLFTIFVKKYDIIFLPSVNIGAALRMSNGIKRKILLVLHYSQNSAFARSMIARVGGFLFRGVNVGYLDRNYHSSLFEGLSHFFGKGVVFKTHHTDLLKAPLGFELAYLPMWIQPCDAFGKVLQLEERPIDLFFAGSLTSGERKKIAPLRYLATERGLNVYWPSERISYEEYREVLSKSKVCLSPEGAGWHCFRHYEALSAGAVPLINFKDEVVTDLENGKNCLIYDSPTKALEILVSYCNGEKEMDCPEKLIMFVKHNHTFTGVGLRLLSSFNCSLSGGVVPAKKLKN